MRRPSTYLIYLITCLANGKIYIGRTTQLIEERWADHLTAMKVPKSSHLRLYRAMRKYGPDAFTIQQIDSATSFAEMCEKEKQHILARRSYVEEIGYNMSLQTDNGLELLDEDAIQRRCHSMHRTLASKQKAKHGIGVRLTNGRYIANLTCGGVQYNLGFATCEEAATAYDKLALYFHGDMAVLNYPDRQYNRDEVEDAYRQFKEAADAPPSSTYWGVTQNQGQFSASLWHNGRLLQFGRFDDEVEAALAVDKARTHLFGPSHPRLNLPERAKEYADLVALAQWFDTVTHKRTRGISFDRRMRKYTASLVVGEQIVYLGSFSDPVEAAKRRDRGVVYYGTDDKLNYPEEIEAYRSDCQEVIERIKRGGRYRGPRSLPRLN